MPRKTLIHPVFVKKNAVTPRNQKNIITREDRKKFYAKKADKQGKTLNDIQAEIKLWRLKQELCGPKVI